MDNRYFHDMVNQPDMMHGVNLKEATERILSDSGLSDWIVDTSSHALFNAIMTTCILDADSIAATLKRLANAYLAMVHFDYEKRVVTYLPHSPYQTVDYITRIDWGDLVE